MSKLNVCGTIFAGLIFLPIAGQAETCPPPESIPFERYNIYFPSFLSKWIGGRPVAPSGWEIQDPYTIHLSTNTNYRHERATIYLDNVIHATDPIHTAQVVCSYYQQSFPDNHFALMKKINMDGKTSAYFLYNNGYWEFQMETPSGRAVLNCENNFGPACAW